MRLCVSIGASISFRFAFANEFRALEQLVREESSGSIRAVSLVWRADLIIDEYHRHNPRGRKTHVQTYHSYRQ